jgi:hypothetical protein
VLEPHGPFTTLVTGRARVLTHADGSGRVVRWQDSRLVEERVPVPADAAPGAILMDVPRSPGGRFVLVSDDGLPPRLRLAITGEGNGFIRKELAPLPSLERQLKEAPAEGYADAIFPYEELDRVGSSGVGSSWFFIRINGLYGRGCIRGVTAVRTRDPNNGAPREFSAVGFFIELWLQPDGSRNLETRP